MNLDLLTQLAGIGVTVGGFVVLYRALRDSNERIPGVNEPQATAKAVHNAAYWRRQAESHGSRLEKLADRHATLRNGAYAALMNLQVGCHESAEEQLATLLLLDKPDTE